MKLYRPITPKKFNEIKAYFTITFSSTLNTKKIIKKEISQNTLTTRPKLAKIINKLNVKKRELSNMLEQIGKEDAMFNDDKLITNIKIEAIEDTLNHNDIISQDTDNSFISKRTTKTNISLNNLRKNIKKKKYSKQTDRNKSDNLDINNNTLELNCNKMPYANDLSKLSLIKKQNRSKHSSRTKIAKIKFKNKNMCIKNVDQFINKPSDNNKKGNGKINLLISPLSKNSPITYKHKKLFKKMGYRASQGSLILNNNNDELSLASNSKIDISKSFVQGKYSQTKPQNTMHFPSKSIIKNPEKVINELQKLFGDKMQLNNETYKNMTDLDKINCINFLLETIKEMNNNNKNNKSKIDGYRELNENKEKQIKEQKTEIKGLKKEMHKLNKLIKTNIQLNKKLEQNIETLKSQLEKEKEKNKSLTKERGKSITKGNNSYFNLRLKSDKSIAKNKHKRVNKSQEIMKKANIFINREKTENQNRNENNISKNINQNNINVKTNINIIIKNKEEKKEKEKEKENLDDK